MRIRNAMSAALIALASAGFASAASAQALSRAEVRQQLVEAQADATGSRPVSNASYPDTSPANQQQVAQAHQQASGYGPGMPGSTAAGSGSMMSDHRPAQGDCVGPASFCSIYFGN
jgi:hypothetical protein